MSVLSAQTRLVRGKILERWEMCRRKIAGADADERNRKPDLGEKMSSMKFAKGPLYAALSIGVVGVALLLLPRLGFELPFEGDLFGAGLGLLTIILLVVSVVMGSRSEDDDEDALTEADLVPSVTFGPQGALLETPKLTAEERKAQKAAEKAAKKEEAERVKFEKQAKKEAAKAAKKAGKGDIVADDAAAWIGEIKQDFAAPVDETTSFGSVSQPVFQPQQQAQPVAPVPAQPIQMTPIAVAAAEMAAQPLIDPALADNYGVPESAVDMAGAAAATDAPMYDAGEGAPNWAGGAYEDPTFSVPFSGESPVATPDPAQIEPVAVVEATVQETDTDTVSTSDSDVSAVPEVLSDVAVEEADAAVVVETEDLVDESTSEEVEEAVTDVLPQFPDVDTALDEEVDDESITEVEERLDKLAAEVLVIIDNARGEVRSIRRDSESARRRHNEQVTNLASALSDSRDEMTRLAEELAEAGEHQKAALDAQSMLTQAQIETQKAELERQQAVARLRQVRVAALRQDPVDETLLAVVEKSLHDLLGGPDAAGNDADNDVEGNN